MRRKQRLSFVVALVVAIVLGTGGVATADITPDPYGPRTATGTATTNIGLLTLSCALDLTARGLGVPGGGVFQVSGTSTSCTSPILEANVQATIAALSGQALISYTVLLRMIPGECEYSSTALGAHGTNTISASGSAGTPVVLSGSCVTNPPVTLAVTLPGVTIF
jgi:hypothetical protein